MAVYLSITQYVLFPAPNSLGTAISISTLQGGGKTIDILISCLYAGKLYWFVTEIWFLSITVEISPICKTYLTKQLIFMVHA